MKFALFIIIRTSIQDRIIWLAVMIVSTGTAVWIITDTFNNWQENKVTIMIK